MIGVSILAAIAAYGLVAYFVVKTLRTKAAKAAVVAVFVLIPTWDIVPGYLSFLYLCTKHGGKTIFKVVDNVSGFQIHTRGAGTARDALMSYGYKFIEGKSLSGEPVRYVLDENGKLVMTPMNTPRSKYSYIRRETTYHFPWRIVRHDKVIEDVETGEQLAVETRFNYYGGWLRDSLGQIGGGPSTCPKKREGYKSFFTNTLKPAD